MICPRVAPITLMLMLVSAFGFHKGFSNNIPLHVRDGLVGVVSLSVGKQIVDKHADYREKENNERPEDLVWDGAVRLEDFDCVCQLQLSTKTTSPPTKKRRAAGRWKKTYSRQ
jgi:hypothetical protein